MFVINNWLYDTAKRKRTKMKEEMEKEKKEKVKEKRSEKANSDASFYISFVHFPFLFFFNEVVI